MLAQSAISIILGFCSALACAAPINTDMEGQSSSNHMKVRSAADWACLPPRSEDETKKRAEPLYWVSTLAATEVDEEKEKRADPLYWPGSLSVAEAEGN